MKKLLFLCLFLVVGVIAQYTVIEHNKHYCDSMGDFSLKNRSSLTKNTESRGYPTGANQDFFADLYHYGIDVDVPRGGGGVIDYQDTRAIDYIGASTAPWEVDNFAVNRPGSN